MSLNINYDVYDVWVADEKDLKPELDAVNVLLQERQKKVKEWESTFGFPCVSLSRDGRISGIATEIPRSEPWLVKTPVAGDDKLFGYAIPKRLGRKINKDGMPYRESMLALPVWDAKKQIRDAIGFAPKRGAIIIGRYMYSIDVFMRNGLVVFLLPRFSTEAESVEKLEHPAFRKLTKKEAFCALED